MSLQVNNTTIIDDNKNVSNVGIMSVGTGSSSLTLNPTSNTTVGIGITLSGNVGNISIAGTITAKALSIPLSLG
jgi:hypothetical protein